MIKTEVQEQQLYTAAGVMSGTSLDGLDIALCRFSVSAGGWFVEIIKAETISYSGSQWSGRLQEADRLDGLGLMELHRDFGRFTGESVKAFLEDVDEQPDIIASHGHTIFHQPENRLTLQIGDGAEIAATSGITAVTDFRRLDVALGGQGAPLVPIGDELLFGQYSHCLNLGGFANVSFRRGGKRLAFDICPVNIVLNRLAQEMGQSYDYDGNLGRKGSVDRDLLNALEELAFYRLEGPRSLGKEWVDNVFMPVLNRSDAKTEDKLRTVYQHIAFRIASVISTLTDPVLKKESHGQTHKQDESTGPGSDNPVSLLITGGGAKNRFLTGLVSEKADPVYTVIPEEQLIDFKEAVIFALLGVLRLRNQVNCLSSVTGASRDNSGGVIHHAGK